MKRRNQGGKANEEAIKQLENAKQLSENEILLKRQQKIVQKVLGRVEVEIAKGLSEITSKGSPDSSVTVELIKMLCAITVSTIERYIDLPEDRDQMIEDVLKNTASLYEFTKQANDEAEAAMNEEIERREKVQKKVAEEIDNESDL